ncbi:MAG: flagellar hook-length control protein FliK [Oligoflexia bacterium]|nr:flagellar hook-length control protein FliK [Oligoflexia bacterium]
MLQNVSFLSPPSDSVISSEPLLNQDGNTYNGDDFESILKVNETEIDDESADFEAQDPWVFDQPVNAQSAGQAGNAETDVVSLQPGMVMPGIKAGLSAESLFPVTDAAKIPHANLIGNGPVPVPGFFKPVAFIDQGMQATPVRQFGTLSEMTGEHRFTFSPTLVPFAADGLEQALLTGGRAGITDGMELKNLANKFVIQFELEPKTVEKEFTALATMPPEQVSKFNLGEMFERIGVEPAELDTAYKLVQEVVEREMIKNEFKAPGKIPGNSRVDRLEELMLATRFAAKNSNPVNPRTVTPYVEEGLITRTVVNKPELDMGESFEDFILKQDAYPSANVMHGSAQKVTGYNDVSTPVNFVEIRDPSDVALLNDAIVKDARILVKDGGGKMDITLNPANMGRIQVVVDTHSNNVHVEVVCSNSHVKQMLESRMPELRLSMAGAGLIADKVQVSVAGGSSNSDFNGFREEAHAYQRNPRDDFGAWSGRNRKEQRENS